MRDITIYKNPIAAPGVCAKCGSQDRDWFVDLGFSHDFEQAVEYMDLPIWTDGGIVYLCCECVNDVFVDIFRAFEQFALDHEIKVPLIYGRAVDVADDSAIDENDSTPEHDDSEPESDDSIPEPESTPRLGFLFAS